MTTSEKSGRTFAFNAPVEIHFFYVVLILTLALILLMTREWTTIAGFTDYLTAAGTITSLVLGVLAIIYSFVSSRQQSDVLGSIERSSRAIDQAVGQLGNLTTSAQSVQKKAEDRTESLLSLISDLKHSISSVHEATNRISEQSTDIAGRVEKVESKIDGLEKPAPKENIGKAQILSKDHLINALHISSMYGLCCAWLVVAAKQANKKFNLSEYVRLNNIGSFDYMQGYLIAWSAAGIFDVDIVPTEDRTADSIWTVHSVQAELGELLASEWKARIENSKPDIVESRKKLYETLDKVLVG